MHPLRFTRVSQARGCQVQRNCGGKIRESLAGDPQSLPFCCSGNGNLPPLPPNLVSRTGTELTLFLVCGVNVARGIAPLAADRVHPGSKESADIRLSLASPCLGCIVLEFSPSQFPTHASLTTRKSKNMTAWGNVATKMALVTTQEVWVGSQIQTLECVESMFSWGQPIWLVAPSCLADRPAVAPQGSRTVRHRGCFAAVEKYNSEGLDRYITIKAMLARARHSRLDGFDAAMWSVTFGLGRDCDATLPAWSWGKSENGAVSTAGSWPFNWILEMIVPRFAFYTHRRERRKSYIAMSAMNAIVNRDAIVHWNGIVHRNASHMHTAVHT